MTVYGYARVSTAGQTLATQKDLLMAAGVERIFSEKVSSVAAKRPQLERLRDQLEAGDILVVTKLDRLARPTLDLLRTIDLIGKEGAGFKSLADPWGGHYDGCGPPHGDRAGSHRRVRAQPDTATDGRKPRSCHGRRQTVRP